MFLLQSLCRYFCLILYFSSKLINNIHSVSYQCSSTNVSTWFLRSTTFRTPYSLTNVTAGFCYGNFSSFSNGTYTYHNSSVGSAYCKSLGGHLAVAYTFEEYYFLVDFVSLINSSLLANSTSTSGTSYSSTSLFSSINVVYTKSTTASPTFGYPLWIGLTRNNSNLSQLYWQDLCQHRCYTNGSISMRDIPQKNFSYTLDYDGYFSKNSSEMLPYFLCRKDFNKCGSSPCLNGGTCYNWEQCFICYCVTGYYGRICQYLNTNTSTSMPNTTTIGFQETLNPSPYPLVPTSAQMMLFPLDTRVTHGLMVDNVSWESDAPTVFGYPTSFGQNSMNPYAAGTTSSSSKSINGTGGNTNPVMQDPQSYTSINVDSPSISNTNKTTQSRSTTSPKTTSKTWSVHYLATRPPSTIKPNGSQPLIRKKIFDGEGLPKSTWFAMGFGAFAALCVLTCLCSFLSGPPSTQSKPFT